MNGFKLPFFALLLLGSLCVINCGSIHHESGLNEEKKDAGEKTLITTTTTTTTTTTPSEKTDTEKPNPNSACGGLKGFLHLCEHVKEDSTKKTRSVSWDENGPKDDDSDEIVDYKSENQEPQVDPVQYEPVPLSETVDKKRAAFDSDESSENGSDESKLTQKSEYSQHAYDAISSTDTSKSNEKLTDSGKNYQEEFSRKPFESESQSDEA